MTRLPFLIEDLEREIRAIAGVPDVKILLALDSESYKKVEKALDSHFGRQDRKPFDLLMVGNVQILDEVDT